MIALLLFSSHGLLRRPGDPVSLEAEVSPAQCVHGIFRSPICYCSTGYTGKFCDINISGNRLGGKGSPEYHINGDVSAGVDVRDLDIRQDRGVLGGIGARHSRISPRERREIEELEDDLKDLEVGKHVAVNELEEAIQDNKRIRKYTQRFAKEHDEVDEASEIESLQNEQNRLTSAINHLIKKNGTRITPSTSSKIVQGVQKMDLVVDKASHWIYFIANCIMVVVIIVGVALLIKYRKKFTGGGGSGGRPGTRSSLKNMLNCCGLIDLGWFGKQLGVTPYLVRVGPIKLSRCFDGEWATKHVFVEVITALNPVMQTRVRPVSGEAQVVFSDILEMLVSKQDGDVVLRIKEQKALGSVELGVVWIKAQSICEMAENGAKSEPIPVRPNANDVETLIRTQGTVEVGFHLSEHDRLQMNSAREASQGCTLS